MTSNPMDDSEYGQPHHHQTNRSTKYGDLGDLKYDSQKKTWQYLRNNLSSSTDVEEKGGDVDAGNYCPHLLSFSSRSCSHELGSPHHATRLSAPAPRRIRDVAPEAECGWDEIKSVRSSSGTKTSNKEPTRTVSFGSAVCLVDAAKQSGRKYFPISAYTTGNNNDILALACLDYASLDEPDLAYLPFRAKVPSIGQRVTATWRTAGEAIQGLTFSRRSLASDNDSWLAVRQPSCTTILQPLLSRIPLLHKDPVSDASLNTPLAANVVVTLPITHTGGHYHSDICFHPQNPRRFAVVNTHGTWSVWKLTGKRKRTMRVLYKLHLQRSGKIDIATVEDWSDTSHYDGWYKLTWIAGNPEEPEHLLVCGRRSAHLVRVEDQVTMPIDFQLGPSHNQTWILDVQQCTTALNLVFFLTSAKVIAVRFSYDVSATDEGRRSKLVCSWNHYRSLVDLSLRIHLVEVHDVYHIFLQSSRNNLITRLQFAANTSPLFDVASRSDPQIFEIPQALVEKLTLGTPGMPRLTVHPTSLVSSRTSPPLPYSFIKLFALNADLELIEAVFALERLSAERNSELDPLSDFREIPRYSYRTPKLIEDEELEEFIVDDHAPLEVTTGLQTSSGSGKAQDANANVSHLKFCDLLRVYNTVIGNGSKSQANGVRELQALLDTEDDHQLSDYARRLLSELSSSTPEVIDVEEDFGVLDTLIKARLSGPEPSWLLDILHPDSNDSTRPTTVETYNDLVDVYLQQLPKDLPNRARVNRERVIRKLALELTLARFLMLNTPDVEDHSLPIGDDLMPISGPESAPTGAHFSSQEPQTQSPQPGPSSSDRHAQPYRLSGPISRLNVYTTFRNPLSHTPPPSQSSSLHRILSHFPTTPSSAQSYTYRTTELALSLAQTRQDLETLDPKQRRRAERLAAQAQRKLARQAELSQIFAQQNMRVPEVVQSSQGPAAYRSSPSRAGDGVPEVVQTQPERGTHGGRLVVPRKKGVLRFH